MQAKHCQAGSQLTILVFEQQKLRTCLVAWHGAVVAALISQAICHIQTMNLQETADRPKLAGSPPSCPCGRSSMATAAGDDESSLKRLVSAGGSAIVQGARGVPVIFSSGPVIHRHSLAYSACVTALRKLAFLHEPYLKLRSNCDRKADIPSHQFLQ